MKILSLYGDKSLSVSGCVAIDAGQCQRCWLVKAPRCHISS